MLRRAGVGVPEYIVLKVIMNRSHLDEITLSYMSNREKSRVFFTLNKQRDAFRGARDRGPSQNTGYYEVVSLVLSTYNTSLCLFLLIMNHKNTLDGPF